MKRMMKSNEDIYKELMSKLLAFSCREDMPSLLRDNANIMGVYFNTLDKSPFSDFKYQQLWYAIQRTIIQDDKAWFYRYWEFADQYWGLVYEFETNKYKKRFREFHIAIGGLLALNEKYEWIEHIAWFTNILPPSYFLIPNTFSQIMDWLIHFSDLVEDPNIMDNRFHLYDQYEGVRAGAHLYMGIVKYLALMMCRLPKMNYNVAYANPMAIPPIYGSSQGQQNDCIPVNQRNIRLASNLKKAIERLGQLVNDDDRKEVCRLIDQYIGECKSQLESDRDIDKDKIIYIKKTLLSEFARQSKNQISSKASKLTRYEINTWFSMSQDVLEKRDFLQGDLYNNINRESVMIGILMQDAYRKYADVFKYKDSKYTYLIRFADLKEALDRFSLTEDYVCLVSGIGYHLLPNGYHEKSNVYNIFTRQSEIILIKQDNLPFVRFEHKVLDDNGMVLLDSEKNDVLYSNIYKLGGNEEATKSNEFVLKVGCYISLCTPCDDFPFVRIKAIESITQETFDFAKVSDIEKLNL